MFGLDDFLASYSDGATLALVVAVAVLLGLRHATDPDHLAAVTTLIASTERRARDAARLGLAWGAGHALTLFVLGVPIVLYRASLPADRPTSGRDGDRLPDRRTRGLAAPALAPRRLPRARARTRAALARSSPLAPRGRTRAPPNQDAARCLHDRPAPRGRGQRRSRDPAREHDRQQGARGRGARNPGGVHGALDDSADDRVRSHARAWLRSAAWHRRSVLQASPSGSGTRWERRISCRTISRRTGTAPRANHPKPR